VPLIDAARNGYVILLWSPLVIAETNRLLTWLWLGRRGGDLSDSAWRDCSRDFKKWFQRVTAVFEVVEDRPPAAASWTDSPIDEWDVPIWTAARRGRAHAIVTENLADGPPPDADGVQQHEGIFFVHPAQFLEMLEHLAEIREWSALSPSARAVVEALQRRSER
ncbi:MAG: hypothetical protein IRY83_06225, partial [Chloroflexi bacterium]|nr:hypothetical protein [Chloroflexota bacterium]